MAKTRKAVAFDSQVREAYLDDESQITINRAFAERLAKMIKGTMEADQLENLITKNRDRIKSRQYVDMNERPIIS